MTCPRAILGHREPAVIAAFVADWDVTASEADALFEDVMAWLWIATRPGAPALAIDAPLRIVDEMWHALVLDTACYRALCARWFGGFVEHVPDLPAVEGPAGASPDRAARWRFIATELGVDRLLRWYVELPLRFDDAWFRTGRRPRDGGYVPSAELIARWDARRGAGR